MTQYDPNILISGGDWKWSSLITGNTTHVITYSFPTSQTSHWGDFGNVDGIVNLYEEVANPNNYFWDMLNKAETHYGGVASLINGIKSENKENSYDHPFNSLQIDATRLALHSWENVANIDFQEIVEYWDAHTYTHWTLEPFWGYEVGRIWANWGELRFANTDTPVAEKAEALGWAYPSPNSFNGYLNQSGAPGDVWLHTTFESMQKDNTASYLPGGGAYKTLIHEIGHAIGLSHPFDSGELKEGEVTFLQSVMDYDWGVIAQDTKSYVFPTTPMPLDIAAIQSIYGPNTNFNSGNDYYEFNQGGHYFMTVYDTGGIDEFRWNGTESADIDLTPGAYSDLSNLGSDGKTKTVAIYETTFIEHATGGDGGDNIIGNVMNNTL